MDRARGTGEVENPIDFEKDRLRDIVSQKLESFTVKEMGDVISRAGEEVVETDNFMAVRDEALAKVRADEPCPASDENAFRLQIGIILVHPRLSASLSFTLPV
jgi:hypothetical protein